MRALPFVEKSFTDQPLIEARLRYTLANRSPTSAKQMRAVEQSRCGPDALQQAPRPRSP